MKKTEFVHIRATKSQKGWLKKQAKAAGMNVSCWIMAKVTGVIA